MKKPYVVKIWLKDAYVSYWRDVSGTLRTDDRPELIKDATHYPSANVARRAWLKWWKEHLSSYDLWSFKVVKVRKKRK